MQKVILFLVVVSFAIAGCGQPSPDADFSVTRLPENCTFQDEQFTLWHPTGAICIIGEFIPKDPNLPTIEVRVERTAHEKFNVSLNYSDGSKQLILGKVVPYGQTLGAEFELSGQLFIIDLFTNVDQNHTRATPQLTGQPSS